MTNWLRWFGRDYWKKNQSLSRREFLKQPLYYGIFMGTYLTPHFSVKEMRCKGTGICEMDEVFMEMLEEIRKLYGKPIYPTSGYRTPEYNASMSKSGLTGPHTTGRAVDIRIYGTEAFILEKIAMNVGMTGIGRRQHGAHKGRFIHLDNLETDLKVPRVRPWEWTYPGGQNS